MRAEPPRFPLVRVYRLPEFVHGILGVVYVNPRTMQQHEHSFTEHWQAVRSVDRYGFKFDLFLPPIGDVLANVPCQDALHLLLICTGTGETLRNQF